MMPTEKPRHTRVSDYLIVIRRECDYHSYATTGSIAHSIGVSNGTASSKLREIAAAGLIHLEPYKGASLTEQGTAIYRAAYRRLQIIELFLQRTLRLSTQESVQQAWAMELTISDSCLAAINDFLEHPREDIRGELILA
jgi:DtxR family transcriptional regulator, Mn-dependent transcriptional regulator